MKWVRTLVLGATLSVAIGTGCAGCFGDNNGSNNGNNGDTNAGTNAGTNSGTNAGTNGDTNGMVIIDCSETRDLGDEFSNITEDTTITAPEGSVCYTSGGIRVSGGILTIEPGVVIQFEENAELTVQPDGRLNAVGTAAAPIVFTSEREVPGFWNGVSIDRSDSIDNILEHVVIQYGGKDLDAALQIGTCCGDLATVELRDVTVEFSGNLGLSLGNGTEVTVEDSTFTNNTEGAAFIHAGVLHNVAESNTFSGNEVDVVFTGGDVTSRDEVSWPNVGVPLRVTDDIRVTDDSFVTVAAGTTMEFNEGLRFTVDGSSSATFAGEEGDEILLTGTEKERGFWGSVIYDRTDFEANMMSHTIVEYAGNETEAAVNANTCCGDSMQLSLDTVTIRESSGYGFGSVGGSVTFPTFENVTFTSNPLGAMFTEGSHWQYVGSGTFSGNEVDIIELRGGNLEGDHEWIAPDVPFRVTEHFTVNDDATLTLEPGTVFEMESTRRFTVGRGAALTAVGTESDPIIWRGADTMAGSWPGLRLDRTANSANELDWIEISDGGADDANLNLTTCCGDSFAATINNITLTNSGGAGILIPGSPSDTTFTGCQNLSTDSATEVQPAGGDPLTIAEFQASAYCQ